MGNYVAQRRVVLGAGIADAKGGTLTFEPGEVISEATLGKYADDLVAVGHIVPAPSNAGSPSKGTQEGGSTTGPAGLSENPNTVDQDTAMEAAVTDSAEEKEFATDVEGSTKRTSAKRKSSSKKSGAKRRSAPRT